MDFSLTEDQAAIADMAQRLFVDYCTEDRLATFEFAPEGYMHELWSSCVETGLHALYVPETFGGSGLGITELVQVLLAQGETLAAVPLWRHQLAAATLAEFAPNAFEQSINAAAAGETLLTLALSSIHRGTEPGVHAQVDGDTWRLTGNVPAVPLAQESDAMLLPVMLPEGMRLVYIPHDSAGIDFNAGVMTHGENVADLSFDRVQVSADQVLLESALTWLDERRIAAVAALQLGVTASQTRQTVEYVNQRQQFDRAVGSFQAVQMGMADAQISMETLRTLLCQLCYRLDAGLAAPSEARSTAWLACETGHSAGHKLQHVHGGVGVDISYPIYRYLYWSRALAAELGGSSAVLESLGDWLADNETLGWKYDLEEHPAL